jgi:hypothetical protein
MTVRDLQPGATIQMLGEQIYITDKQTRQMGVRSVTEFRARRGRQKDELWYVSAMVQGWLDRAQWIENPLPDEGID